MFKLPIENKSGIQICSSVLVGPRNSLNVNLSSEVILNLENSISKLANGDTIGFIRNNKYSYPLIFGKNIWYIFSDYHNKRVKGSSIFYKWIHTPLVSGSIRYPESIFKHEAGIYKINDHGFSGRSEIVNMTENTSIRIWVHDRN